MLRQLCTQVETLVVMVFATASQTASHLDQLSTNHSLHKLTFSLPSKTNQIFLNIPVLDAAVSCVEIKVDKTCLHTRILDEVVKVERTCLHTLVMNKVVNCVEKICSNTLVLAGVENNAQNLKRLTRTSQFWLR